VPVALDSVAAHVAFQRQVGLVGVEAARRLWASVPVGDLDAGWARVGPTLVAAVVALQVRAAEDADPYLDGVLAEQDGGGESLGAVAPAAFAGVASDGRALDSLLYESVIGVKSLIGSGVAPETAMARGGSALSMYVRSTLQDTGRAAVFAGMQARPAVIGWVRILTPPSCSRCAILAGRVYRKSQGFLRHPQDDCRMAPSASQSFAESATVDPYEAFRRGEVRGLTAPEERALSLGADISQVVNARRAGQYKGMTTAEGTSKRGFARSRLRGRRRLTVEAIARVSATDEEFRRRLFEAGYLVA